jgi:hypothetical protein
MNKRIKELAEKSRIKDHWSIDEGRYLTNYLDEKKFAELIVQECGQWFNNRLTVEPDYGFEHRIERNRAVVDVMKEYNTHFGVEE